VKARCSEGNHGTDDHRAAHMLKSERGVAAGRPARRHEDLLDAQDANAAAKGMTYQTLDRNIPGVYYCLINSQYLHFEVKGGIGMNHQA
jgi:hypothetical protein